MKIQNQLAFSSYFPNFANLFQFMRVIWLTLRLYHCINHLPNYYFHLGQAINLWDVCSIRTSVGS